MIYHVTVKTGSKKGPLIISEGTDLTVYLRKKPINGEANTALVKLLAKHFHLPQSSIKFKSGTRSHEKLIEIP